MEAHLVLLPTIKPQFDARLSLQPSLSFVETRIHAVMRALPELYSRPFSVTRN